MGTHAKISFGVIDVSAKADSVPSADNKQPFADITSLKEEDVSVLNIGTYEYNQWRLDGTFLPLPSNYTSFDWGLWSLSMSDASGVFSVPPVLTVSFSENHSSLGVTLHFDDKNNDYANPVNIKWYDGSENLISDMNFIPDRALYFCDNQVNDYKKLVITFHGTSKPYRYLKLFNITFGAIIVFGREDLISAKVLEEINPISSEISINTLNFRVYAKDDKFNILNPTGAFSVLQQKQPLKVYEIIDGTEKYIGTYYLDEWEGGSENTIEMSGIDLIGVMDQTNFRGGIYNNAPAGNIISEIMQSANAAYEMDAYFENIALSGWIPICTHREALHQVAFAIGAIVDCSRSNKVKIYRPSMSIFGNIEYARKFQGQKLSLKTFVSGVEVTAHNYAESNEGIELYNGILQAGIHTITFSEPAHALSITGGVILSAGANYALVEVSTAGNVLLTGKKYIDNKRIYGVYMEDLPAGQKTNVLTVEDATLVSSSNAQEAAQRVYDYYQLRYSSETQVILKDEEAGKLVTIETIYNSKIKGRIEKLDIDLTGGYIADAVIVGTVDN